MDRLIPLAKQVGDKLKARGETVGVSESSSGGLISAALLAVPGASAYYRGGGVIYAANAFRGLMGLRREDIEGMRSSTEPYARFMAETIRTKLRTTWGLCETGACSRRRASCCRAPCCVDSRIACSRASCDCP